MLDSTSQGRRPVGTEAKGVVDCATPFKTSDKATDWPLGVVVK